MLNNKNVPVPGHVHVITVETFLSKIGTYGRFQMCVFILCSVMQCMGAAHVLVVSFLTATPETHNCAVPDGVSVSNETIPWVDEDGEGEWGYDSCKAYEDFNASTSDGKTVDCPNGWVYSNEFACTLAMEFDLVCSNKFLTDLAASVYMGGFMLGAILVPSFSDLFGRKLAFISCQFTFFFISVVVVFIKNYYTFISLRFFEAFFMSGLGLSMYVLCLEWFAMDGKAFAGEGIWLGWTLGYCTLPLLAFFVTDWRYLQLLITIPMVATGVFPWLVPETMHWLVAKHRYKEAEEAGKKAAYCNGVELPPFTLVEDETKKNEHVKKATLWDVAKTPVLRGYAVMMCFIWFINSLVYYGLSFGATNWAGNLYVNFFLAGIIELPAYIILIWSLKWWGRQKPHFVFHMIAGVPLFILPFIPDKTASGGDLTALQTALNVIGKFGITATFGGIYLFTSELYPTEVRNAGLGVSSFCARVGGIIAPFAGNTLQDLAPLAMPLILGGLAIVAGVMCLIIPETSHLPTLETLEDVRYLRKDINKQTKLLAEENKNGVKR